MVYNIKTGFTKRKKKQQRNVKGISGFGKRHERGSTFPRDEEGRNGFVLVYKIYTNEGLKDAFSRTKTNSIVNNAYDNFTPLE